MGARRDPSGNAMLASEARNAADMVVMLMGYYDRRQILGTYSQAGKPPGGVGHAEAAIEHDASTARFNQQRISLTSAPQRREPHCSAHPARTAAVDRRRYFRSSWST